MKKIIYTIYIAVFIVICFLPGVLTIFAGEEENTEKRELSAFPDFITENGSINKNWTKEFDTYFSEHFAFRNKLVNINANLMNSVFKTSAENDVIVGKDDWLYYGYTADDFTGISPMEDWEIEDIAHVIKMMEDYSQKYNVKMIFAAVPNKNTIYPEYMPYNYIKSNNPSNLDRLEDKLSEIGADYCSLKNVLSDKKLQQPEKLLYHKTDTHWNNYGAYTAYQALCNSLGIENVNTYDEGMIENSWEGDLQKMLFPNSDFLDEQVNYNLNNSYSYMGRFRALDDMIINTSCEEKENALLMFRDSFGEAILPFMADNFKTAQFSRIVPYGLNMIESGGYNYSVLEIVERNLANLRKYAPSIPSPECEETLNAEISDMEFASCYSTENNGYIKVYGEIDSEISENKSCKIYAGIDGKIYEAFPVYEEELLGSSENKKHGYSLNIIAENVNEAEIFVETDNGYISTGKINIIKKDKGDIK